MHNEFRTGKLTEDLKQAIGWPLWRPRQLRGAVSLFGQRLKHPILRRRVDRLERRSPEPTVDPRLTPVPSEPSNLKAS